MEYVELIGAILGTGIVTTLANYLINRKKQNVENRKVKTEADTDLLEEWEKVLTRVIEAQKKVANMSVHISKLEAENVSLKAEKQKLITEVQELTSEMDKLYTELKELKNGRETD